MDFPIGEGMTTPREDEFLARINDRPPGAVVRRYEELSKKRDAEGLTLAEQAELITLCSEALGRLRGASAEKGLTAKLLLERSRERCRD